MATLSVIALTFALLAAVWSLNLFAWRPKARQKAGLCVSCNHAVEIRGLYCLDCWAEEDVSVMLRRP
jgi:hypothetical protein